MTAANTATGRRRRAKTADARELPTRARDPGRVLRLLSATREGGTACATVAKRGARRAEDGAPEMMGPGCLSRI